jgi:hypothetical protein
LGGPAADPVAQSPTLFRPQSALKQGEYPQSRPATSRQVFAPRGKSGGSETFMLCVSFLSPRALGLCGLGLLVSLGSAPSALAADIEYDEPPSVTRRYDPPALYRGRIYEEPPIVRRQVERDCRIVHRRGFDEYGREIVRRVRECDEGVVAWRRGGADRGSRYDEAPRVYDSPRPPRDVGPGYRDPGYRDPPYRGPVYGDRADDDEAD